MGKSEGSDGEWYDRRVCVGRSDAGVDCCRDAICKGKVEEDGSSSNRRIFLDVTNQSQRNNTRNNNNNEEEEEAKRRTTQIVANQKTLNDIHIGSYCTVGDAQRGIIFKAFYT